MMNYEEHQFTIPPPKTTAFDAWAEWAGKVPVRDLRAAHFMLFFFNEHHQEAMRGTEVVTGTDENGNKVELTITAGKPVKNLWREAWDAVHDEVSLRWLHMETLIDPPGKYPAP